ncbi:MAG: SDR family oxidoreductase [Vicinamibacteraceae bacterium]|nr:SDR family oxidoreductase [Vicinamibacteraceae bacterium]
MGELTDRVAIITGGARGIGRAIGQALSRLGAFVVLADRDVARAAGTAAEIGSSAVAIETDIGRPASVSALFTEVEQRFGRLDVLVNNAAICRMVPILDISVEEWDATMAVNLRGTYLTSVAAFRIMQRQGHGRIINLASAAAKIGGVAAGAHYSASKAGVICLTKSFALTGAPLHINVNAVCPGPTSTEMTDAWGEATNRMFAERIPWQEYARPEDVADAVAFLATDRARYITGEILDVNGGLVMD